MLLSGDQVRLFLFPFLICISLKIKTVSKYVSLWKRKGSAVCLDMKAAGICKLQDVPMRWVRRRVAESRALSPTRVLLHSAKTELLFMRQ